MARGESLWILTDVAPYTGGPAGVHGVLQQATAALCELGRMSGLEPKPVAGVGDLAPEELAAGGVLALFTIGETPFTPEQREAISSQWRDGAIGVLGVHAATDACHTWDDYGRILGGRFDGHPWTQHFTIEVADRDHPATAGLPDHWPWRDEVYLFDHLRADARVLLRLADPGGELDMSAPGARVPGCGFPLAWCHTEDRGRTFYSALGHFPLAWETPAHLQYLLGGLRWVLSG